MTSPGFSSCGPWPAPSTNTSCDRGTLTVDQLVARAERQGRSRPRPASGPASADPADPARREAARMRKQNERLAAELDKASK